jgi:transglutaminase-like putative cysteine protease
MDVHTRIKILSKSGFDHGTVERSYYAEDGFQDVDDVEGVTYTLGPGGEVQRQELSDDDVFVETINEDYERVKFTLPNLQPGAVIEYRYTLTSDSPIRLPDWTFQHDEPTLFSRYDVRAPSFLQFSKLTRGSQPFAVQDTEVKNAGYGQVKESKWVMKDVPALRKEPFMTTPRDYRSRIILRARILRDPRDGTIERRFLSSWNSVAKDLMDHEHFGEDLGDDGDVEDRVEEIVADSMNQTETIRALYDYVRTSISWNGDLGVYTDQDHEEVLETKTGTSPEVNLLLVSMLRHAGVDAHPVLVSTRDHGKPIPVYAAADQFNHVIAGVEAPDASGPVMGRSIQKSQGENGSGPGWRLLDATVPTCPMSLLPERNLNRQVWVARPGSPTWIRVTPPKTTKRATYARLQLTPDGSLEGTVAVTEEGYDALDSREHLREEDDVSPGDFLRDQFLRPEGEITVSEASVEGRDDVSQHLRTQATVTIPRYAQTAGNRMYLNPLLSTRFSKNPLTAPTRTFPIDFTHPERTEYTLSLQIPEGYEVEELPESQRLKLPKGIGSYTYALQSRGGRISIRSVLAIEIPLLPSDYYATLQKFFNQLVSTQSQQIVLKKTSTSTSSTGQN